MGKTTHVSFPAEFISAHEVGKRLRVITKDGAKIEDTLTQVCATRRGAGNELRLLLHFENVGSDPYAGGGFEVLPDQMVKRIDEDD